MDGILDELINMGKEKDPGKEPEKEEEKKDGDKLPKTQYSYGEEFMQKYSK